MTEASNPLARVQFVLLRQWRAFRAKQKGQPGETHDIVCVIKDDGRHVFFDRKELIEDAGTDEGMEKPAGDALPKVPHETAMWVICRDASGAGTVRRMRDSGRPDWEVEALITVEVLIANLPNPPQEVNGQRGLLCLNTRSPVSFAISEKVWSWFAGKMGLEDKVLGPRNAARTVAVTKDSYLFGLMFGLYGAEEIHLIHVPKALIFELFGDGWEKGHALIGEENAYLMEESVRHAWKLMAENVGVESVIESVLVDPGEPAKMVGSIKGATGKGHQKWLN